MPEKIDEVNIRWQRQNAATKRLTAFGVAVAGVLWPVSYLASYSAAQTGQGMWFAALSIVTLVGAIGATVGTGIGASCLLTDDPPLPGSNY